MIASVDSVFPNPEFAVENRVQTSLKSRNVPQFLNKDGFKESHCFNFEIKHKEDITYMPYLQLKNSSFNGT